MEDAFKEGPSIALVGSLAGEPGRANMLCALLDGRALTASELANEAGVTLPTASVHLAKLEDGGLISSLKQGRHRYFRLSGSDVAEMLETMMGVAARAGHVRTRAGPNDPAMRKARVCYDHLAGEKGVELFDGLVRSRRILASGSEVRLTKRGEAFLEKFGIERALLAPSRRPLCRPCLDWSERRHHLAGRLGAAILTRLFELGWITRQRRSRTIRFAPGGEIKFRQAFG